jgi:hypothetical protein
MVGLESLEPFWVQNLISNRKEYLLFLKIEGRKRRLTTLLINVKNYPPKAGPMGFDPKRDCVKTMLAFWE